MKKLRILFASFLGAVFAIIQIIFELNGLVTFFGGIAVAVLMVTIAFQNKGNKQTLMRVFVYLFVSFVLGGIMSLLYSLFNRILAGFIESYSYEAAYDTARLWIIISLTAIISVVLSRIIVSKKEIKITEVIVTVFTKKYILRGLTDSGNLLKEPFSGKCVILVSEKSEIGKEINKTDDIYKKYIPYKDVNGSGMLKGIIPKEILVNGVSVSAIIASVKSDSFGGCDALVPSALV